MLGVFSSAIVTPPEELVAAGCRTPSPKISSTALVNRFLESNTSAVSLQIGDHVHLAYTHQNESALQPRDVQHLSQNESERIGDHTRASRTGLHPSISFAVKDEIFCMFEGVLNNLGSLRQQYGLAKSANEVVLVIEAYKALRDRAPYPPSHVVGHLIGNFAFVLFDKSTSTLFVASDQFGKVPLYWGITADGYVAFADDANLLKGACGKSLASFPQGCFYSTALGEIRSFENPKNKITAIPAAEEEIWGAKFMVEGSTVLAAMK
ncbi:PREDICTED: stem-specific protein TSJT1-like isoform X2 [Nelumbo nucifera]|uniref:Stem-specific protein TSJT1-like isoform X2 n=1 Tax=Nelumbo nucifera TaxID=4432 RepID=A0A1U8QC90_NELNU|nr:PREDICTED: stem-specific protein TSJT1-like isoform X2 [Nelumbo nucifera]